MKYSDAWVTFGSALVWRGSTNWCESAQTAFCEPICGTGPAPKSCGFFCPRTVSLICQMPLMLIAFWALCSAT